MADGTREAWGKFPDVAKNNIQVTMITSAGQMRVESTWPSG